MDPKPPDPGPGGKPRPDMAALMMELARIRREVEGSSPGFPARRFAGWLLALLVVGALALLVGQGPCRLPGGG